MSDPIASVASFAAGVPSRVATHANAKVFNRILDNAARQQYQPVIDRLFELAPQMMARKIAEANVQQAFVFDAVQGFAPGKSARLLCVGSHEDTASVGLKAVGYRVKEIDPSINYDLNTYFRRWFTRKASYDVVFSTSVIEHVRDDEEFISQVAELLAPGGVGILTCDFNDAYRPGDRIPSEDLRFYTQKDFFDRMLPKVKDCSLVDTPQWECTDPDFTYGGCRYTFATLVFRKDRSCRQ